LIGRRELGREPVTLGPGGTLDGGEILPGFRLPLSEIFEDGTAPREKVPPT
jgi:hypothetical protein